MIAAGWHKKACCRKSRPVAVRGKHMFGYMNCGCAHYATRFGLAYWESSVWVWPKDQVFDIGLQFAPPVRRVARYDDHVSFRD